MAATAAVVVRTQHNANGSATLFLGVPGCPHEPALIPQLILTNPPAVGAEVIEGTEIEIGREFIWIHDRKWAVRAVGTERITLLGKAARITR